MPKIKRFLADAGTWGMGSAIAAAVFFVLSVYEHIENETIGAYWLIAIAFILFCIGGYMAWEKEHAHVEVEVRKNQKPEIRGTVLEGLSTLGRNTKGQLDAAETDLFIHVRLVNHKDVPTTMESYVLRMKVGQEYRTSIGDAAFQADTKIRPDGSHDPISIFPIGYRIHGSMPLRRAIAIDGWICFRFSGAVAEGNQAWEENLTLVVTDSLGGVHEISAPSTRIRFGMLG